MSTNKSNNRRKVLLGLGGGIAGASQLPGSWSKPVVNAIILPSHAALTDDTGDLGGGVTTTTLAPYPSLYSGDLAVVDSRSPASTLLSTLIPEAHAGFVTPRGGGICIDTSSAPAFTAKVELFFGATQYFYTATGVIGGPAVELVEVSNSICIGVNTPPSLIQVTSATMTAEYTITGGATFSGSLSGGINCPQPISCTG